MEDKSDKLSVDPQSVPVITKIFEQKNSHLILAKEIAKSIALLTRQQNELVEKFKGEGNGNKANEFVYQKAESYIKKIQKKYMKALALKVISDREYGPALYELMSGIFEETDLDELNKIRIEILQQDVIKAKASVDQKLDVKALTPLAVREIVKYMGRSPIDKTNYLWDGYELPPPTVGRIIDVNVPDFIKAFNGFRLYQANLQFPGKVIHLSTTVMENFTVDDDDTIQDFSTGSMYIEPEKKELAQIKVIMFFIRDTAINDSRAITIAKCNEEIAKLQEKYDALVKTEVGVAEGGGVDDIFEPEFKTMFTAHIKKMLSTKNNIDPINMFTSTPTPSDSIQNIDYYYLNEMNLFFNNRLRSEENLDF